jgi:thioredoxin-like negative regulator of GroEL
VVGFRALQDNDLEGAERQFQSALNRNKRDADALGGLGLVDLKRGRFAQARDALAQASQLGDASKWKEALEIGPLFRLAAGSAGDGHTRRSGRCAQGRRGADPFGL